jgi:hypothetical protein
VAKILLGLLAGLLSAVVGLVLAYLVGVIVIAVHTKEFLPTVLASVTVLPLMMLFVLLLPTLVLGLLVGVAIVMSNSVVRQVHFAGGTAGVLLGVILLSALLPLVVTLHPGDFTSIVSHPVVAALYGLVIGLVASRLFRMLVVS